MASIPVTDLEYDLESRLVKKLDLMIERCERDKPRKDAWLINEGGEGEGKTDASAAEAYYIKYNTQREVHLFFRLRPMIDFAKKTLKKVIIWDEPAFDSLKTDSNTVLNKDLMRLVSTCRIRGHFLIVNMTKFHRFNEAIVTERCLGMIHMYSKKEIEMGRFMFIRKKRLELLYRDWLSKRQRNYRRYKSFYGSFNGKTAKIIEDNFSKIFTSVEGHLNPTFEDYNRIKLEVIATIGEEETSKTELKTKKELDSLKFTYYITWKELNKIYPTLKQAIFARIAKIHLKTFQEWAKYGEIEPISLGKVGFEGVGGNALVNSGGESDDFDLLDEPDSQKMSSINEKDYENDLTAGSKRTNKLTA